MDVPFTRSQKIVIYALVLVLAAILFAALMGPDIFCFPDGCR